MYKIIMIALLIVLMGEGGYVSAAQLVNSSMTESTPAERFTDNNDGTVTDSKTALMWQQCLIGQTWTSHSCGGSTTTYTWAEALNLVDTANTNNMHGYNDWRLPNVKELMSIVERNKMSPSINLSVFYGTPEASIVWSSSPTRTPTEAYNVSYSSGNFFAAAISSTYEVRLVRGDD